MTIHREHPFLPPEADRDPVRRWRGRLGGAVTLWTAGSGATAAGLTVSSTLVAAGDPGLVLGLLDPDADLVEAIADTGAVVISLLSWRHRALADAFAGVAPAPGGAFRLARWQDSQWGPVLDGASAWLGATTVQPARPVGWSLLVEAVIDRVELGDDEPPLLHRRGRYLTA